MSQESEEWSVTASARPMCPSLYNTASSESQVISISGTENDTGTYTHSPSQCPITAVTHTESVARPQTMAEEDVELGLMRPAQVHFRDRRPSFASTDVGSAAGTDGRTTIGSASASASGTTSTADSPSRWTRRKSATCVAAGVIGLAVLTGGLELRQHFAENSTVSKEGDKPSGQ
ncbi:hypothetical protein I316_03745 [Kwoniella heveanensis BCC8398]|uniref:Uncharacterized protein n=1 Tax=Kwoniella heveanensis BCC8398 TaxID=1296120 RepID=A0A1B9GUN3_9TREE|nr:hypothetical protein I316_03745 [Kwoniella heveanensis BCC8398]